MWRVQIEGEEPLCDIKDSLSFCLLHLHRSQSTAIPKDLLCEQLLPHNRHETTAFARARAAATARRAAQARAVGGLVIVAIAPVIVAITPSTTTMVIVAIAPTAVAPASTVAAVAAHIAADGAATGGATSAITTTNTLLHELPHQHLLLLHLRGHLRDLRLQRLHLTRFSELGFSALSSSEAAGSHVSWPLNFAQATRYSTSPPVARSSLMALMLRGRAGQHLGELAFAAGERYPRSHRRGGAGHPVVIRRAHPRRIRQARRAGWLRVGKDLRRKPLLQNSSF